MSDALSSSPSVHSLFSVEYNVNIGWTLSRIDSEISTQLTEYDALRIINHFSMLINGRKAFYPFITHNT